MFKFVCELPNKNGYGIPNSGCGLVEYVLVDGYLFGDRLLENVMFKISTDGKIESVDSWTDNVYLSKLNKSEIMKLAYEWLKLCDIGVCPKCKMNDIPIVDECDFDKICRDPLGY